MNNEYALLEHLPGGVVVSDDKTRVHFANKAAQELMQLSKDELSNEVLFARVHTEDQADVKRYAKMLKGGEKRMRTTRRFKRGDGTYIILERNVVRLQNGMQLSLCQDVSSEFEKYQHMDRFISIAGHELRNPLSNIQLTAETLMLLSEGAANPDEHVSLLRNIQEQIQMQSRMISDFLDISKISKGKLTIAKEPVDVREILSEAVQHISALNKRTYTLFASEECVVRGDRDRLYQTFFNLLQNAAKYSSSPTKIEVTLTTGARNCTISITDYGVGISPTDQEHIFKDFYQAGNPHEGLGIGLFLASTIIQKHGGDLRVNSVPGKGSTFIISLPSIKQGGNSGN